jgi:riboflavin synthase
MFTGIVEDLGTLREVRRGAESARLRIETAFDLSRVRVGDSIAVDGCCLTVVSMSGRLFDVDAAAETLRVTTLGQRAVGDPLHLERALALGDRLGGHLVSGHVDGVGTVVTRTQVDTALQLTFEAPPHVMRYIITKGSICVDGTSLTVNTVEGARFSVLLIPHTLTWTHLGRKAVGAHVNLEADLIGKYVERLVAPWQPGAAGAPQSRVDLAFLQQHGYTK